MIGAPGKHSFIGASYIFGRSGTSWTQEAELAPYGNPPGDEVDFGSSVALSGGTVLIGADALHTATNQTVGGGYVFVGSGGTWSRQALLRPPIRASTGTSAARWRSTATRL